MDWSIRTLVIWLLLLAVPVQGVAAASMAFCGPGHHGGRVSHAEQSATTSEPSHHCEGMAGQELGAEPSAEPASGDDASGMVKASQAAKQKCSACASCCSLGAILPAVPGVPATAPAPTVFPAVVPAVEAFAADGPERPPRACLA